MPVTRSRKRRGTRKRAAPAARARRKTPKTPKRSKTPKHRRKRKTPCRRRSAPSRYRGTMMQCAGRACEARSVANVMRKGINYNANMAALDSARSKLAQATVEHTARFGKLALRPEQYRGMCGAFSSHGGLHV